MYIQPEIIEIEVIPLLSPKDAISMCLVNKMFNMMTNKCIENWMIKKINNKLNTIFEENVQKFKELMKIEGGFIVGEFINSCIAGKTKKPYRTIKIYIPNAKFINDIFNRSEITTLYGTHKRYYIATCQNSKKVKYNIMGEDIPDSTQPLSANKDNILESPLDEKIKCILKCEKFDGHKNIYYIDMDGKEHVQLSVPILRIINKYAHLTASNTEFLPMSTITEYVSNEYQIKISDISYRKIIADSNICSSGSYRYIMFHLEQLIKTSSDFVYEYKLIEGDYKDLQNMALKVPRFENIKLNGDILSIEAPHRRGQCDLCPIKIVQPEQLHFHYIISCTEYLLVINGKKARG